MDLIQGLHSISEVILYYTYYRIPSAGVASKNDNAMEKLKQLFGVRKNMASLLFCCSSNLDIFTFQLVLDCQTIYLYTNKG